MTTAGPPLPGPSRPATGDGRRPGAPVAAGDPGQMSESESDPFSKIGAATFKDGHLAVKFGRKVITKRPDIPIVGMIDSYSLRNPSVTLRVSIKPTGEVADVNIQHSSGSNEIDQPCLIAMHDWWFEPLRDRTGKAIADTVVFTISFR